MASIKNLLKMIKILLYFLAAIMLSSCSAEHYLKNQPKSSTKRFKKRIPTDLYGNNVFKPSESMQLGNYSTKMQSSDDRNYRKSYERNHLANLDNQEYSHDDLAKNNLTYSRDDNILSESTQGGYFKIGNPYSIFGVAYEPKDYEEFEETGTASWYGSEFHGKKTANGEIYNKGDITAAHPTLPLPSIIRATNIENGKVAIVRVNDRGPFAKNRIIDFSEKSAELLGFREKGTTQVKIELLRQETDEIISKLQSQSSD